MDVSQQTAWQPLPHDVAEWMGMPDQFDSRADGRVRQRDDDGSDVSAVA